MLGCFLYFNESPRLTQYDQDAQSIPFPTVLQHISGDILDKVMSPEETDMMFHGTTTVSRCIDLYETYQLDSIQLHNLVQITNGVQSTIDKISRNLLQWLYRNKLTINHPCSNPVTVNHQPSLTIPMEVIPLKPFECVTTYLPHLAQ